MQGVDVQQRHRRLLWRKGFPGQVQHDRGVLAAGKQQRDVAALGGDLTQDEDRFGFELGEVGAGVAVAVEGVVDAVLGFVADVPGGHRHGRVGGLRVESRELRGGGAGRHRGEGADDLELAGGFAGEVEGAVEVAGAELLEGEFEEDAGFAEAGGGFEEDERVARAVLRRSIVSETAFALAVLALVAWFGTLAPPASM